MGYMEIASYLAIIQLALKDTELSADTGDTKDKMLEAVRESQMIMFRLAVEELFEKSGAANDN